jgi:hypothetical protein
MLFTKVDLPFAGKLGIIAALAGLVLIGATLAQSAEQTLRKRQVKGSNPLEFNSEEIPLRSTR